MREEPFDELSAWMTSPTLTRHSHLMRAQRGNFHLPGDLRTARSVRKTQKLCQVVCRPHDSHARYNDFRQGILQVRNPIKGQVIAHAILAT